MKESNIIHENGRFWVCDADGQYTVYRITITHSQADSSYPKTDDGKSLAIARCNYLALRHNPDIANRTIAQKVADAVKDCTAVTLYGGYAVKPSGERVQFPTGVQEIECRNDDGRVTMSRYRYADNSVLIFRWSDRNGPSYRTA